MQRYGISRFVKRNQCIELGYNLGKIGKKNSNFDVWHIICLSKRCTPKGKPTVH